MKILQINAVYGVGSTGKIVEDIHNKLLEEGIDSYVFWAIKCKSNNKKNFYRIGNTFEHKIHAILRRLDNKQGWHSKLATKIACNKIKSIKPDIIHLHNLHSNFIHLPTLLKFLGNNNYPIVITLHDCWFFTGGCTHYIQNGCDSWKFGCKNCRYVSTRYLKNYYSMYQEKKELFANLKKLYVLGVSRWTSEDAKKSLLKNAYYHDYIYNWIDLNYFNDKDLNKFEILKKYNLDINKKIILGVSQGWSNDKGLKEVTKISQQLNDIQIVLVGNLTQKLNYNVISLGYVGNREELVQLYKVADVVVNPSKMETFGLVTAEAMACGTPVVAYENSGTKEILNNKCGYLAKNGDLDDFLCGVKTVLERDKISYSHHCIQHVCKNFEKNNQINKIIDVYKKMITEDDNENQN